MSVSGPPPKKVTDFSFFSPSTADRLEVPTLKSTPIATSAERVDIEYLADPPQRQPVWNNPYSLDTFEPFEP